MASRSATCPRSRASTPPRTCAATWRKAWARCGALLTRFDEINARLGEPMDGDEMEKLLEEQARVQDAIEAANGWDLDRTVEIAMDALRVPAGGCRHRDAVGRRGPPRGPVPPPAAEAGHAAPRRADEPPGRGVRGLARALPQGVSGHGRRHHPRSVLPRQRRGLDPRAGPRRGHPLGGELHLLARSEAAAAGPGGQAGQGAAADARAGARVGADVAARAPGEVQGAARLLRGAARRGPARARRHGGDHHPDAAAPRRPRGAGGELSARATAIGCSSTTSPSACRGAASSASSARTARARRRCSA